MAIKKIEDNEAKIKTCSYFDFEEMFDDLKNKKIGEMTNEEIAKYILLKDELRWMHDVIGDDKYFYSFKNELLEELSDLLNESIFNFINEDILYNNDLHIEPSNKEFEI